MLTGAHSIIYSRNPEADRALFRKIFKLPHIDVGEGWLIFALPPSEIAFHPSEKNDVHELYLLCDDIRRFVAQMRRHRVHCSLVETQSWGLLTRITLPGGGKLGVYQPLHERPKLKSTRSTSRRVVRATKWSKVKSEQR